MISLCSCPYCEQTIEFAAESAGAVVPCPACEKELTLAVPGKDPMNLSPVEPPVCDLTLVEIRMDSGDEIRVKAIQLFDEYALCKIAEQRAKAVKLLGGVSTGLGAIGSLESVIETAVVISAVEGLLSSVTAESGKALLKDCIAAEKRLRGTGVFCPVGDIQEIDKPNPGLWRVPMTRPAHFAVKGFFGDRWETKDVESAFIYNGSDFISVLTDQGAAFSIRWSAVERFEKITVPG